MRQRDEGNTLPFDLVLVVFGVAVRQVDRWWFSDLRSGWFRFSRNARSSSVRELTAKQRERRNDVTPMLVMAGHWVEILGFWLLCARPGLAPVAVTAVALAIKARHLQEVAVHRGRVNFQVVA